MLQNKSAYLVQTLKVKPLYLQPCCKHSCSVLGTLV